jgi:hypothetical protein
MWGKGEGLCSDFVLRSKIICDERLFKYGKNVHCNIGSGMGFNRIGETPFEPLKEEQDDGMMNEMVVEKHVNALNDSFIKKFKQKWFCKSWKRFY